MTQILLSVLTLSALGLAFGIGLAYAGKIFFVKTDPKTEKILAVLPGANCGVCGFAGCQALAWALAGGRAPAESCIPGGHSVQQRLAEILGVQAPVKLKKTAVLLCYGGKSVSDKCDYHGKKDCLLVNMLSGGQKACWFGCLGFGSCVNVCPFGAITMGPDGLPVINEKLCTGCNKCVRVCPKGVLALKPVKNNVWVGCSSTECAAAVTKVCRNGCIGCRRCVSSCKFDAIKMVDNLAKIDYTKCVNCRMCVEVCPTKAIKTFDAKN